MSRNMVSPASAMRLGTSVSELENNTTSNDSTMESSTDNDDCVWPMFVQRLVSTSENAEIRTTMPAGQMMRNHDSPMHFDSIAGPPIGFARPVLNEGLRRKFKFMSELANPTSFQETLNQFESRLTPIQEYTEILLKSEKNNGFTQTRINIGPLRVLSGRAHARANALQPRVASDSYKLCRAANMNNTEMVEQLLKSGVNVNCWDRKKQTPLHLASSKGYAEVVGLLLKYGANPNIKDALGNNPLHLAACTLHMDVVTLLLKAGSDVSSGDFQGRSPLHLAQSKLLQLNPCKSDAFISVKQMVLQVIEMLLAYFDKKNNSDEVELLNAFQTRLQISDTGEMVKSDIEDLLNSLSTLKLNK